jgi:hypothetical protein
MEFRDEDLKLVFDRALRNVLIATAVGIPIIWVAWGWRSALMFLIGGAISATIIVAWRGFMSGVIRMWDAGSARRPLGSVLFWFFIHIVVSGGVVYVSLRSLDGRVAALLMGIALMLIAVSIEAIRIFRSWTA